jgi:hypothetical protein
MAWKSAAHQNYLKVLGVRWIERNNLKMHVWSDQILPSQ